MRRLLVRVLTSLDNLAISEKAGIDILDGGGLNGGKFGICDGCSWDG